MVLFDGECNFCNSSVAFIIRRDPQSRFLFAPLASEAARAVLRGAGFAGELPDSVVLVEGGRVFTLSSAGVRIARQLRWPWPLLAGLWLIPKPIRDVPYRWFARNRYRWFGRREACLAPSAEVRSRFLDLQNA